MQVAPENRELFCVSCEIVFNDEIPYKAHYRTEFHRYNLLRRIIQLPPATYEKFLEVTRSKSSTGSSHIIYKCDLCRKSFMSNPTLKQHMASKKHKDRERAAAAAARAAAKQNKDLKLSRESSHDIHSIDLSAGSVDLEKDVVSVKGDGDLTSSCLFCKKPPTTLEQNLSHMKIVHSFYIYDEKYCVDKTGLLAYLAEKVNNYHLCLYCDIQFESAQAAQNHMTSKAHTFLNFDNKEEYCGFYDYSSSYEERARDRNLADYEIISENDLEEELHEEGADDGIHDWQDVVGDESSAARNCSKAEKDKRYKRQVKESIHRVRHSKAKLMNTGEILLPNGRIVGNRIWKIYYKQTVRPNRAEEDEKRFGKGISRLRAKRLALTEEEQENRILLQEELAKMNKLSRRQRSEKRNYEVSLGLKSNKLQKHFRLQCPI